MDKSTVCNMALRLIGEHEYVAGTPGYESTELFFPQCYRELLAAHNWSFARRRKELQANERGEYELPPDCLRIVEVRGVSRWRKYGRMLRPENQDVHPEIELIYTSSSLANRGEVPEEVPEFVRALVTRLAAYVAVPICNDPQRAQGLMREAREQCYQAMTHDTQQDNSNDQHPLDRILNESITNEYGS